MTMLPKQYLLITESWKHGTCSTADYLYHACFEGKGLDVDVTATTVDEAKENILAVLRKCNPGKLSGDRQSVSDSQSKKENAKAETLISEMELI